MGRAKNDMALVKKMSLHGEKEESILSRYVRVLGTGVTRNMCKTVKLWETGQKRNKKAQGNVGRCIDVERM